MTDSGFSPDPGALGVVIVTYNSSAVIGPCLDSLLAAPAPAMRIVVVDNASADDTVAKVGRRQGLHGVHTVALIDAGCNGGYGAGVNLGLRQMPDLPFVWILNPDCRVPPRTPFRLLDAAHRSMPFALLGGRTLYADPPGQIQSEGGRVGRWTGVCRLVNRGRDRAAPGPPSGSLDFISGANMLASRAFLDRAGPMDEDYFLYYEEVDWAARRCDLPLKTCAEAVVYHQAGTAIGSPAPGRRATAFSNYFNYRSRMRFLRRHRPMALPVAAGFALAKTAQMALGGAFSEAGGALAGTLGLPPPRAVRARLRG